VFDEKKLRHMNGTYIRELPVEELTRRLEAFTGRSGLGEAVAISREKFQTLSEFWPLAGFFFDGPADDPKLREKWLAPEETRALLAQAREALEAIEGPWTVEDVEAALSGVVEREGVKPGKLFQPLRVALAGTTVSPGIFETVAVLGRAAAEGLMAGGVLPVMKHIPGHGRAGADSHLALPVVDASREELERHDFAPFRMLTDLPLAMTAHVVYTALDPEHPATTSRIVMDEIVRGHLGCDGLVMTDDLSMHALSGSFRSRTEAAFAAGCDMALHCNGQMDEMAEVAEASPVLEGEALRRAQAALARIRHEPEPLDPVDARARLDAALAMIA
jgi:hypothetical protein